MKRKIFSILFALVLVVSFSLVTAVPAGADPGTLNVIPFTLEAETPATSQWVTAEKYAGSSSVELSDDGTSYANVWFDLPGDVTLGEINLDTTSFWCKSTAGANIPYLMFEMPGSFPVDTATGNLFRINNDADESADYGSWAEFVASSTTPDWQWEIIDTSGWTVLDGGWDTWADLVTEHGALVVECIVVEISGLVGTNTAYVDDITVNGTTYYGLIQDAIDSAAAGDTINVGAGTYTESLNINEEVTIQGESSTNTTIDGEHTITVSNVSLSGFEFDIDSNYGIIIDSDASATAISDISITSCKFTLGGWAGVHIGGETGTPKGVSNVTISSNAFNGPTDKLSNPWKIGGYFTNPVGCQVTNVDFENNTVDRGSIPINLQDQNITDILINNNTFTNTDGVVYVWGEGTPTGVLSQFVFTNNTVDSTNSYGVGIDLQGAIVFSDGNFGAGNRINYNNFTGIPGAYGFEAVSILSTLTTYTLNAECNYWGHASGPTHLVGNPGGTGALVSDNVDYQPWLLVAGGSCYEQTQILYDGWTLVSTDNWIDCETLITPATTSWQGVTVAYKYTDSIVGYEEATVADLVPVNALYLKTDGGGGIGIVYSGGVPGASSKDLEAGWNLISSATETNARAVLSPLRYIDVGEEQGVGLATLVSQGKYNRNTDSFYLATFGLGDWFVLGATTLNPFDGYWVYMNAGKTFGVILD